MKIPKKVKIAGQIYRVIVRDRDRDGVEKLGSMRGAINMIWIDSKLVPTQKESTFLHEIIEAINWQMSLRLSEDQICQLETSFYQVLKDNKLLK